jgi:hypothetical protein
VLVLEQKHAFRERPRLDELDGGGRAAIGDPDAEVTPVLQRLVDEGKLPPPKGKKRWDQVRGRAPAAADRENRLDWLMILEGDRLVRR